MLPLNRPNTFFNDCRKRMLALYFSIVNYIRFFTGAGLNGHLIILSSVKDFMTNLASRIQSTGKQYHDYLSTAQKHSIFMRPIAEDEILKIIYKFDKNKSAGHDGIGNLIVKGVAKKLFIH